MRIPIYFGNLVGSAPPPSSELPSKLFAKHLPLSHFLASLSEASTSCGAMQGHSRGKSDSSGDSMIGGRGGDEDAPNSEDEMHNTALSPRPPTRGDNSKIDEQRAREQARFDLEKKIAEGNWPLPASLPAGYSSTPTHVRERHPPAAPRSPPLLRALNFNRTDEGAHPQSPTYPQLSGSPGNQGRFSPLSLRDAASSPESQGPGTRFSEELERGELEQMGPAAKKGVRRVAAKSETQSSKTKHCQTQHLQAQKRRQLSRHIMRNMSS